MKKGEYSIEDNVPIPEELYEGKSTAGRPTKYPFKDMEVGDSFLYMDEEYSHSVASKLSSAARNAGRLQRMDWTVRKETVDGKEYLRIWRIK